MNPEQAFNIVAQMVVIAPATLADHQLAQQALGVLKEAITPSPDIKGSEVTDG